MSQQSATGEPAAGPVQRRPAAAEARTLYEIAEMAYRVSRRYCATHGIEPSPDWYVLKLQEEAGEVAAAHLTARGQHRHGRTADTSVEREVADLVCFALLVARDHGVDVTAAINDKWGRYDEAAP